MLSFLGTDYGLKAVPGTVTEANFHFPNQASSRFPVMSFAERATMR